MIGAERLQASREEASAPPESDEIKRDAGIIGDLAGQERREPLAAVGARVLPGNAPAKAADSPAGANGNDVSSGGEKAPDSSQTAKAAAATAAATAARSNSFEIAC